MHGPSLSVADNTRGPPHPRVKVRQQLQIKTTGGAPPANWARTLVTMVQQEGTLSIWKGLSASLLREGSYSGIRMVDTSFCQSL